MAKLKIERDLCATTYDIQDEVADLLQSVSEERCELRDLIIWMVKQHDFEQYEYFREKREKLLEELNYG